MPPVYRIFPGSFPDRIPEYIFSVFLLPKLLAEMPYFFQAISRKVILAGSQAGPPVDGIHSLGTGILKERLELLPESVMVM